MTSMESVKDTLIEIENDFVDSSRENSNEDLYEAAEPNLLNLPVEILLKICSFLDVVFLKYTFSKVCRRFEALLIDDHFWKYRVFSKIKNKFPVLPDLEYYNESPIDWQDVALELEVEHVKWTNVSEYMRHIVVKDVHFATVDAVLLVNKGEICISGGRDRSMALWNVFDIKPHDKSNNVTTITDTKPKHIRHDAHTGWVWDLACDNEDSAKMVYSASWDNTVRAWDLENDFTCVQTFRCGMAALSVVSCESLVLAGLYSSKVLSFDMRVGQEPVGQYVPHRGAVLGLDTHKNLIASLSEDKTFAIYDRVAGKIIAKDIKIPVEKAFPVSLNWSATALYIGDSKGCLHVFHPEKYTHIKTHELWPEQPVVKPSCKISGIYQSDGTLTVCSDRGEIKFLYNCSPPQEYSCLTTNTSDVTQLCYLDGVLVIGTCESALEFWVPNERYSD